MKLQEAVSLTLDRPTLP